MTAPYSAKTAAKHRRRLQATGWKRRRIYSFGIEIEGWLSPRTNRTLRLYNAVQSQLMYEHRLRTGNHVNPSQKPPARIPKGRMQRRLSPEVLGLLARRAQGESYRTIGDSLGISVPAVCSRLQQVRIQLRAATIEDAISVAIEQKLITVSNGNQR